MIEFSENELRTLKLILFDANQKVEKDFSGGLISVTAYRSKKEIYFLLTLKFHNYQ